MNGAVHPVLESISDGFLAMDAKWCVLYANEAAERMTRKSRQELVGRNLWESFPEAVGSPIQHYYEQAVLTGELQEFEIDYAPLGIVCRVRAYPQPDGGLAAYFLDITQDRQAQVRIRELTEAVDHERALLSAILDQSPVGIAAVGAPEGALLLANQRFREIWGGAAPVERIAEYTAYQGFHADGRPYANGDWPSARALLAGEVVRDEEIEIQPLHGPRRVISVNAAPVRNGSGEIIAAVGAMDDISERKESQKALEENAARLRLALEATSLGIHEWDIQSGAIRWDSRVREIWGVDADVPITFELFQSGLLEEDVAAMQSAVEAALRPDGDGVYRVDYRVRNAKTGVVAWVSARGKAMFAEGKPVRMVGYVQDITPQKRAELALRESERRLSTLAEVMPGLVTLSDAEGYVTYVNPVYESYTGVPAPRLHGRGWLQIIHPDDRMVAVEKWQREYRQVEQYAAEYRFRRADGVYRWHTTRAVPVRDADGRLVGWVGVCVDIEDQRRLLEQLARSNDDLRQFAWAASHDLQEPLRMVVLYSQLLEKRASDVLTQDNRLYIHRIVESAQRIETLLAGLRDYWRVSGTESDDRDDVDLNMVLRHVQHNLRRSIAESGATVEYASLPTVPGNEHALCQLFQNLISNSVKYRDASRPPRIRVTAIRTEEMWRICVEDNGIGIDPAYFDRIFKIFKRLHTSSEYPGTGIGLALCQKIVERHGGTIWVESEPGAGSRFLFTLPVS